MQIGLKIGQLARMTDCLVETIRYYEKEGLLQEPARSTGNYRLYGPSHVERLQFIRHCRSLDMTLDEISRLLRFHDNPSESCDEVNVLLEEHIHHVNDRIAELQILQKQLNDLRNMCRITQSAKDCRILKSLAKPPKNKTASSVVIHRGSRLDRTHK